jgi:hypothetical protein
VSDTEFTKRERKSLGRAVERRLGVSAEHLDALVFALGLTEIEIARELGVLRIARARIRLARLLRQL